MQIQVETAVVGAADKMTVVGSAGTVVGWLTSSEAGVVIGILIGVMGLALNWYFKHRADKRSERAYEAYMAKLESSNQFPLPDDYEGVDD